MNTSGFMNTEGSVPAQAGKGLAVSNRPNGHNGEEVAAGRVYGPHSGYRKLKADRVSELVCDFTLDVNTRHPRRRV